MAGLGGRLCSISWLVAIHQPGLKNIPLLGCQEVKAAPPRPPAVPVVTLYEHIAPWDCTCFSPPDKKSIKGNVHDSRGRLTAINTREMSQDIEEVMD